jgi:hypothetical protein
MNMFLPEGPRNIMDSSFAFLDVDDLLLPTTRCYSSNRTCKGPNKVTGSPVPKSPKGFTASSNSPGGFCMARPTRGPDRKAYSPRHLAGVSSCLVDTPGMGMQNMCDVHVQDDRQQTVAASTLAARLEKVEAQLLAKEKECIELRELVDPCSRVLPRRTMAGRKAASTTSLGRMGRSEMKTDNSFKLGNFTRGSSQKHVTDSKAEANRGPQGKTMADRRRKAMNAFRWLSHACWNLRVLGAKT